MNNKYTQLFEPTTNLDRIKNKDDSSTQLIQDFDHLEKSLLDQEQIGVKDYLQFLDNNVIPFTIDVSSPRYIGHMTSRLPNFIPEIAKIITRMNQNVVKVETSNILTKLERQVLYTFHKLFFDLHSSCYPSNIHDEASVYGTITSSGSIANMTAMLYARNRKLIELGITKSELKKKGFHKCLQLLGFKEAVIVGTRLMHYSFKKSANILGIGEDGILYVDTDDNNRMCVEDLKSKLETCKKENVFVISLVGIAGATETGAIDPLHSLREISNSYGIHFHIDAAWGGGFIFSDKYKHKLSGIHSSDSITFCAHKLLYSAQGASMCLFRNMNDADCYSTTASYQSQPGSLDLGQFSLEGSRAANSLLIHALLRIIGKEGYSYLIEKSMQNTEHFKNTIKSEVSFQLLKSCDLNIVNFRYIPSRLQNTCLSETDNAEINKINEKIQERLFNLNGCFVSKTSLTEHNISKESITVFRVVISNPLTTTEDIDRVITAILNAANVFDQESKPNNVDHFVEESAV